MAGPVRVRVEPSRSATQSCVVVGIPFPVNGWVLNILRGACAGGVALADAARLDETILAFAAYEAARDKLDGSTVDAVKNRVAGACCGGQGGEFIISVTTAPTLTSARKCAGLVIQSLRWGSLFQRYSDGCQALGVRADKAAFSAAAEEANRAVQARVAVVITGRVAADDGGALKTADALRRKLKDAEPREPGRRRAVHVDELEGVKRAADLYTAHPAPGLAGVVVRDFVNSHVRGRASLLASGVLYVPKQGEAQAKRLDQGDRAAKYVQALQGLGDEARGAVVFVAARGCSVATNDLVVAGPFGAADLEASIRGALHR